MDAFGQATVVREGLDQPLALARDTSGNYYVSQQIDGSVTVFDTQWQARGKLGIGVGEFQIPNAIAVDSLAGTTTVYVSDGAADEIKAYRNGSLWVKFGGRGAGNGQFRFPSGLWISPAGELFVVDQGNDRVVVVSRTGAYLRAFPLGASTAFSGPSGRALGITGDGTGQLYVADAFQGFVKVFNTNGAALGVIGDFGSAPGKFQTPTRLTLDNLNRLCVASLNNARVELFGLGDFLHVARNPAGTIVAAGTEVAFSAITGGPVGADFQWYHNGIAIQGGTNATLFLHAATVSDAGRYSVQVTSSEGTLTSSHTPLTVVARPEILEAPIGQTFFVGARVEFHVKAAGDGLSYQWLRNEVALDGATNADLVVPEVQIEASGDYSVAIQNPVGAVVSTPASLRVRPAPLPPQIDNFSFSTGTGLSFQINGEADYVYTLQCSTNLEHWFGAMQLTNDSGTLELTLPLDPEQPQWFYRVFWQP